MNAKNVLHALDTLAAALDDEDHIWSRGERALYEMAVADLKVSVREREHILSKHCWCEPVSDSYGPGGHIEGTGT